MTQPALEEAQVLFDQLYDFVEDFADGKLEKGDIIGVLRLVAVNPWAAEALEEMLDFATHPMGGDDDAEPHVH